MREIKIHTDYNRKDVGALQSTSKFEKLPMTKILEDIAMAKAKGFTSDEELYEDGIFLSYNTSKVFISYEVRLTPRGNLKMELKKAQKKEI